MIVHEDWWRWFTHVKVADGFLPITVNGVAPSFMASVVTVIPDEDSLQLVVGGEFLPVVDVVAHVVSRQFLFKQTEVTVRVTFVSSRVAEVITVTASCDGNWVLTNSSLPINQIDYRETTAMLMNMLVNFAEL